MWWKLTFIAAALISQVAEAKLVVSVDHIANAIKLVQPKISKAKNLAYALGIMRAAERYDIDPFLLVAIAQQESSFREGLPEGKAGERGLCQILKGWASNSQFRAEFGYVAVSDFDVPSNNFMFAAWLLKTIKHERRNGEHELPYWTFYNGKKLKNRQEYFAAVSRHLERI